MNMKFLRIVARGEEKDGYRGKKSSVGESFASGRKVGHAGRMHVCICLIPELYHSLYMVEREYYKKR